ncbi:MAG: transaldolase [Omnitrophica WOR_2 bacterium RIFCSPLOWO2_12_FULL_63_16]|nr:MAG: transaldolase [Omnitrophica WOR_2 bacterium RIFCSPLOWO2_12_FULL_63_16]
MSTLTGIFLDTGNLQEVRRYHALGIIRGVTTNPTILVKDGVRGGWEGIEERCKAIAGLVAPLPVSVEATTNEPDEMREQARRVSGWAQNINVKIPIHGPEGGTDNLRLIHELETQEDIRVNVTAMMSAQQCLLAAMAGATYVSLFGGRVNNMGYNACGEIRRLRGLLDAFGNSAKIIVGSTREALNIIEWFEAGADIVTAVPSLLDTMLVHPYSKETVRMFLADGETLQRGTLQPRPVVRASTAHLT